jgi:hypothetical protein
MVAVLLLLFLESCDSSRTLLSHKVTSNTQKAPIPRLNFSFPQDSSLMNADALKLNAEFPIEIDIEIDDSREPIGITELTEFFLTLNNRFKISVPLCTCCASPKLKVRVFYYHDETLKPLSNDLRLPESFLSILFLDKLVRIYKSEYDIISDLAINSVFLSPGKIRTFIIDTGSDQVSTIQVSDSSVTVSGRCPGTFNFLPRIISGLDITEVNLLISSPSETCDISSIVEVQSMLTKLFVLVNSPVRQLLNLELLSCVPNLKSFILRTDKFQSPRCPVKLPISLSSAVEYIELSAGQVIFEGQKITINSSLSNHQIEIRSDYIRQHWISDIAEPARSKILYHIADDGRREFYYPDDKQVMIDEVNSDGERIKHVRIFFTGSNLNLSASKSDVQEVYDIFYPPTCLTARRLKYPQIETITFLASNGLDFTDSKKFPFFEFDGIPLVTDPLASREYDFFEYQFGPDNSGYVYKDFMYSKCGSKSVISDFHGVNTFHVQVKETCEIRGTHNSQRSQKSILRNLVVSGEGLSSNKEIVLSNLSHLESIDMSLLRGNPVSIKVASNDPFAELTHITFPPKSYSIDRSFILQGDPSRDVVVKGANIGNSIRINGNLVFDQMTFLGEVDCSVLDLRVSNLKVEQLVNEKCLGNYTNPTVIRFQFDYSQTNTKVFMTLFKKFPNLKYGEFVFPRNTEIPESIFAMFRPKWEISHIKQKGSPVRHVFTRKEEV